MNRLLNLYFSESLYIELLDLQDLQLLLVE